MDDLNILKTNLKSIVRNQIDSTIQSYFNLQTQSILNALSLLAYSENKMNKFNYINQWVLWAIQVQQAVNPIITLIDGATTSEELGVISLDLLSISGPPPKITIEEALQINF